jgi:hypothetical protein
MSVTMQVTLWCDHPGCDNAIQIDTMFTPEAREHAKIQFGWGTTRKGREMRRDQCPRHKIGKPK